jgi:predicted transcriptional regulator
VADLTVTAASVLADPAANLETGTAGETITAGQSVYKSASDGKLYKADANLSAGAATTYGVALHGSLAGQPLTIIRSGNLNPGATVVVGTIYVQSAAAGGIAPVSDLASGWNVTQIGIGTTASNILVDIKARGVAVP